MLKNTIVEGELECKLVTMKWIGASWSSSPQSPKHTDHLLESAHYAACRGFQVQVLLSPVKKGSQVKSSVKSTARKPEVLLRFRTGNADRPMA